jgi:hypothetical protein
MFCIAAFIVLGLIGIFSASKRQLAKKAWACTLRRVTFRPCDTSFKEEAKNHLLAKVANKTPRLVKAADIGIEVASFLLVIFTIWSLLVVVKSGLNLYVWGTCNPANGSSCSLGSEACSIDQQRKSLWTLTKQGKPYEWFVDEFNSWVDTITNIPNRLKTWQATDYLPQNPSYYNPYDATKPTALEILDPGCSVCAQLFQNIKTAGFENNYNLTYIAYPIPDASAWGQYKFANSYIVVQYLEAIKRQPLATTNTPVDWQIIERIFSSQDEQGIVYQIKINNLLSNTDAQILLQSWLGEFGYSNEQLATIVADTTSDEVQQIIANNMAIVEDHINTVKIPSLIFNGHRHDGLVNTNDLN